MQETEGECPMAKGTASTEGKVAEFGLFDEQKSLPFHQSFVKRCQRIMLLSSWVLLLGYNIFISIMFWLLSTTPNKL